MTLRVLQTLLSVLLPVTDHTDQQAREQHHSKCMTGLGTTRYQGIAAKRLNEQESEFPLAARDGTASSAINSVRVAAQVPLRDGL